MAKLVPHVDALVTDISKKDNKVLKYLVSPCLHIMVFGRLRDTSKPKIETAYNNTVTWVFRHIGAFR